MLTLRGFISDYAKGFGGKHGVQANSQDAVSNRQQFFCFCAVWNPQQSFSFILSNLPNPKRTNKNNVGGGG